MAIGLRLKTDDGKFAEIMIPRKLPTEKKTTWRVSDRFGILWSTEKSGYASPDFTVNGVRFYYNSSEHRFYCGSKYLSAYDYSNRQSVGYLYYNPDNNHLYFATALWWNYVVGFSRQFYSTGDSNTPFQNPTRTYDYAYTYMVQEYITGNTNGGGVVLDSNGYGMSDGLFINFSYDLFNGSYAYWTTSNILDAAGYSYTDLGTLEQAKVLFGDGLIIYDWNNPYSPGGYTDPTGDDEPPDPDEVPNERPDDLPSQFSDLSAGVYRAYAMDDSELSNFALQLWKPSVLGALRNYFEKPTDIILGLRSYPFEVYSGTGVNIGFNWLNEWVSSGVVGHPISGTGIQNINFGMIYVPRPSGVFYDYQPFSSAMLHLPYVGFVPMKMNEIVGKTLSVKYNVDLLSGDFTAWVIMGGSDETEDYYNLNVYGYYQGNISKPLPLAQQDMWQVYKKGAEIAFNAAAAIGTLSTGSLMKATGDYLADMPLTGKGAVLRYDSGAESAASGSALMGDYKRKGTQAVNSALEMSYVSAPIERNGFLDGSTGRTSSQECFLIITYPDQSVPENQSILGYPTNIPGPLSKVTGYTEVKEIRLHSGIATEYELAELEGVLRGGIIV